MANHMRHIPLGAFRLTSEQREQLPRLEAEIRHGLKAIGAADERIAALVKLVTVRSVDPGNGKSLNPCICEGRDDWPELRSTSQWERANPHSKQGRADRVVKRETNRRNDGP